MNTSPRPLAAEQEALSRILHRVMDDSISLEDQCKYVPRIASVTATVARVQAALAANDNEATDALLKMLAELAEEEETQE